MITAGFFRASILEFAVGCRGADADGMQEVESLGKVAYRTWIESGGDIAVVDLCHPVGERWVAVRGARARSSSGPVIHEDF